MFLGSGSVIYGCHHEQEMTKMGGLFCKMKIPRSPCSWAWLAIAGIPCSAAGYSKDAVLAHCLALRLFTRATFYCSCCRWRRPGSPHFTCSHVLHDVHRQAGAISTFTTTPRSRRGP